MMTSPGCLPLDLLNDKKITLSCEDQCLEDLSQKYFLIELVRKQLNYPWVCERAEEQWSQSWDGSRGLKVDSAALCRD